MGRRSVEAKLRAKIERLEHDNELLSWLNGIFKDEIFGSHPAAATKSASARAESTPAAEKSRDTKGLADDHPNEDRRTPR